MKIEATYFYVYWGDPMRILRVIVRVCAKSIIAHNESLIYALSGNRWSINNCQKSGGALPTPQSAADAAAADGWLEGIQFMRLRFNSAVDWDRTIAHVINNKQSKIRLSVGGNVNYERVLIWSAALGLDVALVAEIHRIPRQSRCWDDIVYTAAAHNQMKIIDLLHPSWYYHKSINIIAINHGHVDTHVHHCGSGDYRDYTVASSGNMWFVDIAVKSYSATINDIFLELAKYVTEPCDCKKYISQPNQFHCNRAVDWLGFMREVKALGATNFNAAFGECRDIRLSRQLYEWGATNFSGAFKCMASVCDYNALREVYGWAVEHKKADQIDYNSAFRSIPSIGSPYTTDLKILPIDIAKTFATILQLGQECGAIA